MSGSQGRLSGPPVLSGAARQHTPGRAVPVSREALGVGPAASHTTEEGV
ncbi:hypothetical protein [Streptomyces cucumeris]